MNKKKSKWFLQVLAASFALLLASIGAHGQSSSPTSNHDVLIIGSSSVNGALGHIIENELRKVGFQPLRYARSSSGFARPDFFDWEAEIPRLGPLRNLKAVIVYAGGNDGQALRLREQEIPEEIRKDPRKRRQAEWIQWNDAARWSAVYEARVRSFINALCAGGVRRVLVLLPTEGENRHWTERMERIQSLQASATQGTQCGRVIDPRGVRLKEGSTMDGIHLSRSGAQAVWEHIKGAILNALRN